MATGRGSGNKGGRPRKLPEASTTIQIVVPDDTLKAYDRWVEEVQVTVPGGMGITRADMIRDVLQKAIPEHLRPHPPAPLARSRPRKRGD